MAYSFRKSQYLGHCGSLHDNVVRDSDSDHDDFDFPYPSQLRPAIPISTDTSNLPNSQIVTSSTATSREWSTVTSTFWSEPNSSFDTIASTSTSSVGDNSPGKSSEGLGTVTGIVLGSVLGAVAAVLVLFTLAWLAIRARRRGSTPADIWSIWIRNKDYMRRKRDEKSVEYRKPELDAVETGVGYNTGAPHEIYVPRVGYDSSAEMNAVKSPVELPE
ncbi:hypothetical protein F4678DRAFT_426730 [Xylaria arbuscula]|nr:hypothetical protein F4678DRAFT_426730 [Xylaria arbuscula]